MKTELIILILNLRGLQSFSWLDIFYAKPGKAFAAEKLQE
jgi:hypothetical protein